MIATNLPSFVEEERGIYPPLGLMYIASYVNKNTKHKAEILDMPAEEIDYKNLKNELKKREPDVVGIQATTFTLLDSIKVAKIVKSFNENIPIVFGGPHPTIYPEETVNLPFVDFVVLNEGELSFSELLDSIKNKNKLKRVKGIAYKKNDEIIITDKREFIKNLDELPFPDRKLVPYKKYYSLIAKKTPITTMITSRGCPYKCIFCDRPHLGKIFRARSAKNVVDEMEECIEMGIKEIFIYDDTFTIDKKRVIKICEEILKRNLEITWDIRARVDTVNLEILTLLKKAGCERIHYGIESGDQYILNVLRKGITLTQIEKVFKLTKKVGITTLAYFMIGNPNENFKQIMKSINLAKKLDPDYVHFSITIPFPNTDLYKLGLSKGIFFDFWKRFAENPSKNFTPEVWCENFTKEELSKLLKKAYKSFYLRPRYIIKTILKTRSFEELKRKLNAGVKILLK